MRRPERIRGLYLCQFSQGTLKVGMGVDVVARLAAHKSAGSVFGITVARSDIVPCDTPNKAEKLLIEWCAKRASSCNGREWFNGVEYDACLAAAKSAASAMIGPHPQAPAARGLDGVLRRLLKGRLSKEGELYEEVRQMMGRHQVASDVINALDYLHVQSERVRAAMRLGSAMPEWYDVLNCFGLWEVELWFDDGRPSLELLGAAASAVGAIEKLEKAGEGAHV